jgi:hypothetical protein
MNEASAKRRGELVLTVSLTLLILAGTISALTGSTSVNEAKVTGILLALAAFVPVFVMLVKAMKNGTPNEVLGTFVGGFFFKLVVLGIGIWWGIKKAGFLMNDFTIPCLSFLVAFQIIESLYFAGKK